MPPKTEPERPDQNICIYICRGIPTGPRSSDRKALLQVGHVKYVTLMCVSDAHPDAYSSADADVMLRRWLPKVTGFTVEDWWADADPATLSALIGRNPTDHLRIFNFGGVALNLSKVGTKVSVTIHECSSLTRLALPQTFELILTNIPRLTGVSWGPGDTNVSVLHAVLCPLLQLGDVRRFRCLQDLYVSCNTMLFPPLLLPSPTQLLHALRPALRLLSLRNVTCPDLDLAGFPLLEEAHIEGCVPIKTLFIRNCKALISLTVQACPSFRGTNPMLGIDAHSAPKLRTLCFRECPDLEKVALGDLPSLVELVVVDTGLRVLTVDGQRCPLVEDVRVSGNPKLWDSSCILTGPFPKLAHLDLSSNRLLAAPLKGGSMPSLHYLDLGGNRLRTPVDLSRFDNLRIVRLKANVAPLLDRGGNPFVLSAWVSGVARMCSQDGPLLMMHRDGRIAEDRLAPVEMHASEYRCDSPRVSHSAPEGQFAGPSPLTQKSGCA